MESNQKADTTQATLAQAAPQPNAAAGEQKPARAVTDPREVAATVMARLQQVKSRRDQMTAAVDDVVDIAQQLTRAYARQVLLIDQLRRRIKVLEVAASHTTAAAATPMQ